VSGCRSLVRSYVPAVVAALISFVAAAAVAAAVGGLVHRTMGDTPTGRVVRAAAPTLVMAIAVFMILSQLGIAQTIVNATDIALIGAVALGSALAFGLDAATYFERANDETVVMVQVETAEAVRNAPAERRPAVCARAAVLISGTC